MYILRNLPLLEEQGLRGSDEQRGLNFVVQNYLGKVEKTNQPTILGLNFTTLLILTLMLSRLFALIVCIFQILVLKNNRLFRILKFLSQKYLIV